MANKRQHPKDHDSSDDDRIVTAAATVVQVAEMVGLSRARFYQLLRAGVFPAPERHTKTTRPYYTAEGQRACLAVRRTGTGVNGKPVPFNRILSGPRPAKPAASEGKPADPQPPTTASSSESAEVSLVLEEVQSLKLDATAEQVVAALRACFPEGTAGYEDNAKIVAVFRHLKQRNRGKV